MCFTVLAVGACSGNSSYRADPSLPLVIKPGVVAVDVAQRKKSLGPRKVKQACHLFASEIPLLNNLKAPTGYGLDDRYNKVSAAFRRTGTACFAGEPDACQAIQQSALDWARHFTVSHPGRENIFNDTLTINMRLLVPMISALGIAEANEPMSAQDRAVLDPWLKSIVRNYEHGMRADGHYKASSNGITSRRAAGNHAMMSSLAAMSFGAWAGDDTAFQTGLDQWNITLKSMRPDGSLPVETRRGARALFYQGRAIAALIQIAERADAQGIDLYSRSPTVGKLFHQTVKFFIDAVIEPERVLRYAKRNVAPGPDKNYKAQDLGGTSSLSWVAPYVARFPNHPNTIKLLELSSDVSYLAPRLNSAVMQNGVSAEWIGVDARCFYAAIQ